MESTLALAENVNVVLPTAVKFVLNYLAMYISIIKASLINLMFSVEIAKVGKCNILHLVNAFPATDVLQTVISYIFSTGYHSK